MKSILHKIAIIAIGILISQVGNAAEGIVFEKDVQKQSNNVETFKYTFQSTQIESDYFLSVVAKSSELSLISVKLNGKTVSDYAQPKFLKKHLLKVQLKTSNTVEIKIAGKKASSASVKIIDLEGFAVRYGPTEITRKKELLTKYKVEFSLNQAGSDHLLLIEGNPAALKDKSLATIKLNGKTIFNPLDMIFDKNNRILKLISVKDKNTLDVSLFGAVGSKIKISVLSPIDTTTTPSPGALVLANHKVDQFNKVGSDVIFNVTDAQLDVNNATISHNGNILNSSQFSLSANRILIPKILVEGRNDIFIYAFDTDGAMLYWEEGALWAGSATVKVGVYNQGNPISGATVTSNLGDDANVGKSATTNANGIATLQNVPARTVSFIAKYQKLIGTHINYIGGNQSERIDLIQMIAPSTIDNNDFSKGLEGWETFDSDVQIVPHQESGFNWTTVQSVSAANATAQSKSSINQSLTFAQKKQLRKNQSRMVPATAPSAKASGVTVMAVGDPDFDLRLSTGGKKGPSQVRRAFRTKPGTANVKVRYRFITSEVPGGYYGSEFNDGYSVLVTSGSEGQYISDRNNMNSMGLGAFTSSGASNWMEESLAVNPDGDQVQIDLTVSNVGDEAYDSSIEIDFIEETPFVILKANLFDIDGNPLEALSLSRGNTYFSGNTRIHGSIEISGEEGDSVSSLELQVLQGGSVLATGDITTAHSSALSSPFTASGKKTIAKSLLFNIPNAKIGSVNQSQTTYVNFKIVARSARGKSFEFPINANVKVLPNLLLTGPRFSIRDNAEGGDDWGTPECLATTKKLIGQFSGKALLINDISNMNGGNFSPHGSHKKGLDADFKFDGFSKMDAATAQTLLDIARSDTNITLIGVTYSRNVGDPFYDLIRNQTIRGMPATAIIQVWADHEDHFHFRCAK